MIDYEKTGQLIQSCRREQNLTQKELAERLGVTDRAVSKWETGKSFPDVSMLKPLAECLGISVGELLDGQRRPDTNLVTAEEAGEVAIRGIRLYARQNIRCHRVLLCVLGVLAVLLIAVGLYEYDQYRHQPLNFQEDDLTFGALIFHEEDGSEYRWELDDAFGQELRAQITEYLRDEMQQGTSMYGSYHKLERAKQEAYVELEGLLVFYDVGYYDYKSEDSYSQPMVETSYRIFTDLCRELVSDGNYVYTGENHFQDGEQTLDVNCELTEVRMERVIRYLEEKVMEPEHEMRPDCWTNFSVNKITRLTPAQYEAQTEFEWLRKEIDYRDLTSWRIYDVELTTEYIGEFGPWIPQYPEGDCHLLVMAAGDINSDISVSDDYAIWHYWPEYAQE